jgi:hypothetical protein
MLKPYPSLSEALKVPDVQDYIAKLRTSYSPDTAEQQLQTLRASGDLPARQEAAPRTAPPKPRSQEPPPKAGPDFQVFYPVAEEPEDIPMTMPPRKKPVETGPKPTMPPPARSSAGETAPRPTAKPPRPPAVSPYAMEPVFPGDKPSAASEKEEHELATGYWVSTGLFVILLLAGLALAGYTLAQPFVQDFLQQWNG